MCVACIPIKSVPDKKNNHKKVEKKSETEKKENKNESVKIKVSPDKYTWYIKNYVGKNAASFGYTSIGGRRLDSYGEGLLKVIFVTEQGKYIDISNEGELKKYVVVEQNVEPNTELKYTFEKDSEGKEYDNLVESQTIEEIVLVVKNVGSLEESNTLLTEINVSPDKYTYYIRDYVGRNLASCGYLTIGGELRDEYGASTIVFVITADDGSYVDVTDESVIKKYVVTEQDVSPNTELKLEYEKDSNGKEYSNLIHVQNIEEVELRVSLIEE